MLLFPKHPAGCVLALLWLALCSAVLALGFAYRESSDSSLAVFWFLTYLTLPIGAVLMLVIGFATVAIDAPFLRFWSEPCCHFRRLLAVVRSYSATVARTVSSQRRSEC